MFSQAQYQHPNFAVQAFSMTIIYQRSIRKRHAPFGQQHDRITTAISGRKWRE
jgi:hypothetical protein